MPASRFAILISVLVYACPCAVARGETLFLNPASGEQSARSATAPAAVAPQADATQPTPAPPAPSLSDKQSDNAKLLLVAQQKLQTAGPKDPVASQEVAFYQTRGAVLAQQEAVEQQIKDLQSRKSDIEAWTKKPLGDKKFKFADLDRMKDDLASEQSRASLLSDRLDAAKLALQKAQSAADDSQAQSQRAQKDYENGKAEANAPELALAASRAQQAASLA